MPDDGTTAETGGTAFDRRSVLTRLGVGAAVVWTAPVVLSSPALAAGTLDGCACGTNIVVNGNAETGTFAPWDGSSLGPLTWAELTTAGLAPLPGWGTYAFAVNIPATGPQPIPTGGVVSQRIDLAPECGGAPVTLTGGLGVFAGWSGAGFCSAAVGMRFFDSNGVQLSTPGFGLNLNASAGSQANRQDLSSSATVPAGSAYVIIRLQVTVVITSVSAGGAAMGSLDNLSLVIDCPV